MKKYFLSLVAIAAAMLFATSCQESLVEPQLAGPTTFNVQLPEQMGTKAIGDKENVNQLLVAVYSDANVDPVALTRATATSTSGEFKVQFNLLQDQSYDIVFWAQVENEYVAANNDFELKSITMKNDYHNNENGAAFFAYVADFVPTGSAQSVTLKRPFAQLNLGTTSQSLKPATGDVSLVSSEIKIKGLAQRFNTITGMGENPTTEEVTYFAEIPTGWQPLSAAGSTYEYVSMDYLPIVGDDKAVFDIEANIVVKDAAGAPKTTIKHKFTSVPVQENYRTNIVGNLISSTSDFIVSIDDTFVDENGNLNPDNDYLVVDNVYAAYEAFNNGETHVAINNIGNTQTLQLPNNGKELYLQLPDSDGKITIMREAGNFNISVPDTNPLNTGLTIIIVAPNSTVGFTGQALVINSTTASNTLNLSDANVGTIIVEKGNVILQDETEVGTVLKGEDAEGDITIYVENGAIVTEVDNNLNKVEESEEDSDMSLIITVAKFRKFAQLVNEGTSFSGKTILLLADLDLNNEEWTPIGNSSNRFKGTFDGNNHTISNLVVEGGSSSDQGLFGFTTDGEIKNLTVENAKVSGRTGVGVVAGQPYTSKYTNITVKGHVEVRGLAYVGGVGGYNAYADWTNIKVDVDETSYVNADSRENGKAYRTYVGGVVGFNGEGGHSFTNITSNIDVKGSTCDVGGLFGIAHYNNKFINCSSSGDVEIYAAEDIDSAEEIGGIAGVWHNENGTTVTFTNCSFTGNLETNLEGVELSDNNITGKAYKSTGTGILIISVDGVTSTFVNSLENLKEAIKNSVNNIILTGNIDAKNEILVISKSVTIDGCGHKLTSSAGRAINVSGVNGVTIKNLTIECSGERAINIIQNATNVTIDNVTATAANYTVNVAASAPEAIVNIENSTLNGLCTVNVSAENAEVYVNNSTVNCNDNNTTEGEAYAALSLNRDAVGGKIIASNTVVNVTEDSDSHKGRNGAEDGEVTINGSTEGVVVMVAAIIYPNSDYYHAFASLKAAIDFAQDNTGVVTLIRSITVEEKPIDIEEGQTVVLDLNGKTLKAADMNVIKNNGGNLTIKNGTVTRTGNVVGYSVNNASGEIVIEDAIIQRGLYTSGSKMTATNATISHEQSSRHAIYAWNCEVTINSGRFHNDNAGNATLMASGSSVVTINGGTFSIADGRSSLGWTSSMIDQNSTAQICVKGGLFNGGFRINSADTKLTIEGGEFNTNNGSAFTDYSGTKVVKGGKFTDQGAQNWAKKYIAEGYEMNPNGEVVVEIE